VNMSRLGLWDPRSPSEVMDGSHRHGKLRAHHGDGDDIG
jgi:hypothetical protein